MACFYLIARIGFRSKVLEFIFNNSTIYFMFFSIQSDSFKYNEQLIFSKFNILLGIMSFKVQK